MSYKSTILIVDDEPVMHGVIEGLLPPHEHRLAFASGGYEALEQAKALIPDLILLDVMMPDMDGFEVCQQLRATPNLAEVPIIMLTALDDRESRLQGIAAGADDFVSKPFDKVELQTRIQTVVRLDRFRRLLAERSKFEWVVEQAADGYLLLSEQADILYANAQARLYLGLPADPAEAIGPTFLELVKSQYQCEPQAAWAAWPERSPEQISLYLVRPESAITDAFWLQVELMNMTSRSNERYLVSLRDITATVIAQRVMWTFHDQVSHKLKTPLTLLTGFLNILKEERATLSDPEQDTILTTAYNNALRLQAEVMSIFEYLQGPHLTKLGSVPCKLADIPAIVNKIKVGQELKSIKITYAGLKNRDSAFLPLSDEAMEQILWELLDNARKFHPEQTPQVDIRISTTPERIRFQIGDDGLTLSPQQLARMWTPYYQAEKYFSGQVPGMGLGLSMVASMVWSVGGTCYAYNRPDRAGIIVELVLPLQNGAKPDDRPTPDRPV